MKKTIDLYLYILPFYSLIGILLSAFRTAYAESYSQTLLLFLAIIDLIVIISGWKLLFNNKMAAIFFLLIFSCLVGLLNNDLSRRMVTDFTLPFFFFSKVFLFAIYWERVDFFKYITYYSNIAFWGSLILLPFVYFIFSGAGATRLAIFPPMELPFSVYMQNGGIYFFFSLIIILLYGKRAQLGGALFTFALFILIFKRREIIKYLLILVIGLFGIGFLFENFSENLAISRLKTTFDGVFSNSDQLEGLESVSAGRDIEIETLLSQMTAKDYIIGKGIGFTYDQEINGEIKETANAHFSPLGFISKYGLLFTLFIYWFLLSNLWKFKVKYHSKEYLTAYGIVVFVFFESFFAYALFVTPVLPVGLSYLLYFYKNRILNKNGEMY